MKGIVCVFSLKNPAYPEYLQFANCAISSIDVHPTHPHMLVAGLVDGNVAVYNLQKRNQNPAYISTAKNGKHQDVVWQVNTKIVGLNFCLRSHIFKWFIYLAHYSYIYIKLCLNKIMVTHGIKQLATPSKAC